ncbi:MAG: hypothetical protein CMI56_01545 [Parcubacteria group bacterium]|jgi:hypothetical protein|nr:hypothetical protein [Parcubacteria group bacterium]|tara:strand:- start:399 stop:1364 length:966 start_codon:yes stop_codon:yes gene_type:complete
MNLYTRLSLISSALALLIGTFVVLFSTTTFSSWQNLLIATFILAQTHFVIGFIYQSRSVFRQGKPIRMKMAFIILSLFAVLTTLYILFTDQITLLGLFVVPYFMVHILLNEHTLATQQTGIEYPWTLFVGIFGWFTALLLLAVPGNSFFYQLDLSYFRMPPDVFLPYLTDYAPLWVFNEFALGMLVLTIGILIYGVFRLRIWYSGIPLLLVVFAGTSISLFFEPIAYVYLFTFILSYHFILWMLHFGIMFHTRPKKELYTYILLHLVVAVPLLVAAIFREGMLGWIYAIFLHSWTLAIMTYIHITLAFLNEKWFQRWFRLT